MANLVKFSPQQTSGMLWDEGGKDQILQILISHGDKAINSIQFVYVEDKKVICSKVHGEPHGLKLDIVTFDYPREYLISLRGQYDYGKLISIAFGTNNHEYGPFGKEDEGDFYSKLMYNFKHKSSFGGFHGSVSNSCVQTIGIYIKPLQSLPETETDIGIVKSDDDQSTLIVNYKLASKLFDC